MNLPTFSSEASPELSSSSSSSSPFPFLALWPLSLPVALKNLSLFSPEALLRHPESSRHSPSVCQRRRPLDWQGGHSG